MNNPKSAGLLAASICILARFAFPQAWTNAYTSPTAVGDCGGLPANLKTGFAVEPVVSQALFPDVAPYRVIKMAFYLQPGARNTDIYIAEKGADATKARILYYDGTANSLKVIGTLANAATSDAGIQQHGLLGIALNPETFAEDHFLYLFYSFGSGMVGSDKVGFRVTRVTLDAVTREIDFGTEKVLLHIPAGITGRHFTGGAMAFDHAGNLYISVGDNETLAMGPGNTADLRGSILRIKPDASIPRGYSVPAGNFGEYWAQRFESQGRTGLAEKYRDSARVRREIYIKGVRNVYSFAVDPWRPGTIEWSQCGPDAQRGETHSVTDKPAFGGWPFWVHADKHAVRQGGKNPLYDGEGEPTPSDWENFNPVSMSVDAPVNTWPGIGGVDTLPPYHIPFYSYTAMGSGAGGPIVRYQGGIANPGRMPPHLDNTIIVTDFAATYDTMAIWAVKYDTAAGATLGNPVRVFTMSHAGRPGKRNSVDFQQGADGALYMIDWGGSCCLSPQKSDNGIVRISYTGTCQDPGMNPVRAAPGALRHRPVPWLRIRSGRIVLSDEGDGLLRKGRHTVMIMDLYGRVLRTFAGTGAAEYPMPKLPAAGLYVLRAETPAGTAQRTFYPL